MRVARHLLSFLQPGNTGRNCHANERVMELQPHNNLQELWQVCIQEMYGLIHWKLRWGGKRQEISFFFQAINLKLSASY